jgi:8-oxo-dGTP pyrophosphatase MutT (NUDIX family)
MLYIETEKSMTRRANYTVALKDSLAQNEYVAGYDAEVASVAVMNGDLLLMGKRRDNGKWTLPGGHLNPGETPHDGGLRELYEEAGIQAHALTTLGQRGILTDQGKFVMVYAYYLPVETKVTTKLDPDKEITEWRWFKTANGLPKYVMENMHVSRNFVLNCLGLQKSSSFGQTGPGARGGHIVRYTRSGRPVYAYHEERINKFKKKKPKLTDSLIGQARATMKFLTGKSFFFVEEMMKSVPGAPRPGHKYLRRYKAPNGEWAYVYHEGEAHGRVIPEEAVHMIRKLADLGDEHARDLHASLQDHSQEKLDILRKLGDLGDHDAIHHLKKLGIDHADDRNKRHAAKIERELFEERNRNPLTKTLEGSELATLHGDLKEAVDRTIFTYLRGHIGTEAERKLREASITLDTVMRPALEEKTVIGALKKLHESLKAVERAHTGIRSANTGATSVGGYANQAWNTALTALRDHHMIPEAMFSEQLAGVSGRAPGRRIETMDPASHMAAARGLDEQRRQAAERAAREHAERQVREARERAERQEREAREAREAAEREERERRENAEALGVHQESINDMVSYFGTSVPTSDHPNIAKNLHRWWGRDFKFKNFVKHLNPGTGEQTEIKIGSGFLEAMRRRGVSSSGQLSFPVYFEVLEKSTGRGLTSASRTVYKNADGSITWSNDSFGRADNDDLRRFPGMARGLYKGVERFLKEVTANWTGAAKENTKVTIGICANSGWGNGHKGALVWAKHCFDWSGGSKASEWRRTWNGQIDRYAGRLNMSPEQVRELKDKVAAAEYPHQFVNTGFVLTKEQAERAIGGDVDFDFKQVFTKKGYCDIGDVIMIDSGTSWSAENYVNKTTGRAGVLNAVRTAYYDGTVPPSTPTRITGRTATPAPAPAPLSTSKVSRSSAPMNRSELESLGWTVSSDGSTAHLGRDIMTSEAVIRTGGPGGQPFILNTRAGSRTFATLREAAAAVSAPAAPAPAPAPTYTSDTVRVWMRAWPRRNARGQDRITLSPKRLRRLLARSDAEVGEFMRVARGHLSPAARRRVMKAMRDAGRRPA